jgi:hypothetical protein
LLLMASSDRAPDDLAERYRDFVNQLAEPYSPSYRRAVDRMTGMQVEWYRNVVDTLASLTSTEREPIEPEQIAEDSPPSELMLTGAVGSEATAVIVVENHAERAARPLFLLSDFVSASGHSARPPVRFEPSRPEVAPGDELPVSITVPLDEERFPPGKISTALLVVRGVGELEVTIRVLSTAP